MKLLPLCLTALHLAQLGFTQQAYAMFADDDITKSSKYKDSIKRGERVTFCAYPSDLRQTTGKYSRAYSDMGYAIRSSRDGDDELFVCPSKNLVHRFTSIYKKDKTFSPDARLALCKLFAQNVRLLGMICEGLRRNGDKADALKVYKMMGNCAPDTIYASTKEIHKKLQDFASYHSNTSYCPDQDDYKEAIAELSLAIKMDSKDACSYLTRAALYERIGRKELAQKDRETAKDLTPEYYIDQGHRARTLLEDKALGYARRDFIRGEYKSALDHYNHCPTLINFYGEIRNERDLAVSLVANGPPPYGDRNVLVGEHDLELEYLTEKLAAPQPKDNLAARIKESQESYTKHGYKMDYETAAILEELRDKFKVVPRWDLRRIHASKRAAELSGDFLVYSAIAGALFDLKRYDDCIAENNKILKLDPSELTALKLNIRATEAKKDWKRLETACSEYLHWMGQCPKFGRELHESDIDDISTVFTARATAYKKQGKDDLAVKDCDTLKLLDATSVFAP